MTETADTRRLETKVDAATTLISRIEGMLTATLPHIQSRADDHENRIRMLEKRSEEQATRIDERKSILTRRDAILTLIVLAIGAILPTVVILWTNHH